MGINNLDGDQINLLIEIIPQLHEKAINTIGQTLIKIRDGIDLNEDDKIYIEEWGAAPKEGHGYKAAKALAYIVIEHFRRRGAEI